MYTASAQTKWFLLVNWRHLFSDNTDICDWKLLWYILLMISSNFVSFSCWFIWFNFCFKFLVCWVLCLWCDLYTFPQEHHIRTGRGTVSVIVYGDQEKPALITYPDLALNREFSETRCVSVVLCSFSCFFTQLTFFFLMHIFFTWSKVNIRMSLFSSLFLSNELMCCCKTFLLIEN